VKELIFYAERLTNRLIYTARFIFQECMGLKLVATDNLNFYRTSNLPRLSYHSQRIASGIHIGASGFLEEKGIHRDVTEVLISAEYPILFPLEMDADMPFDLFAAVFFMISRYEEYSGLPADHYGRFDPSGSLAYKHGFLHIPVVDLWINDLEEKLKTRFPALQTTRSKFTFIPTIDIDSAWAYLHKGFFRSAGGMLQAAARGQYNEVKERLRVLFRRQDDPFDCYDTIIRLHNEYAVTPVFFILFAKYGKYDKGIRPDNKYFVDLIRMLQDHGKIGIHPSVRSTGDKLIFQRELLDLDDKTGVRTLWSRQHYLMLRFPGTYERLIETGIERDFSMGYASLTGFRAGTGRSFLFYNLIREEETSLRIIPFQVMDRTLKDYMGLDHRASLKVIAEIIARVKEVNGIFSIIWHNEAYSDKGEWKGWLELYRNILDLIYK
jgi:hypothetical protein